MSCEGKSKTGTAIRGVMRHPAFLPGEVRESGGGAAMLAVLL